MNQISSHASHCSFTKRGTISFTSFLVHCIHHFNCVFKLFSFYFILQFSRESCLKLDIRTFTIISLYKYFSAILKRKDLLVSLILAKNFWRNYYVFDVWLYPYLSGNGLMCSWSWCLSRIRFAYLIRWTTASRYCFRLIYTSSHNFL